MNKKAVFVLLGMIFGGTLFAQFPRINFDSINQLSRQDHELMLKELGITELRHGPSGNPEAPNAANTDEAKVQPYFLPNPLEFNNGLKVTSAEQWDKRRIEIIDLFENEIYGKLPENIPTVNWKLVSEKDTVDGEFPVKIKVLEGVVDNSSYSEIDVVISLTVGTPANNSSPVPVIMEFGFNWPGRFGRQQNNDQLTWKQQLLQKGWGYAVIVPMSIQADFGAGLRQGIIGLVNKGNPRKPDDWGALRAWAWGASRAIDYFETDNDVDEKRIGIEGLSRYGKAAIVTMAFEPRIAIGFIGSSGAGGTKLLHRVFGEQVENLASSAEYHWFAGNFIKYAADPLTQEDLPVDAHHLMALCAPRPVFISSGSASVEGQWVDAKGMFLGGAMAGPVYELLGKKSMRTMLFPPQETLVDGDVAFRQHEGGHTTGPNWPWFIKFAERYFEETQK
jgi:hypothetical protein